MASRKKPKILWNRVIFAAFILIVFIWVMILISSSLIKHAKNKNKPNSDAASQQDNNAGDNTINKNYDFKIYEDKELYKGSLILVNNDVAYKDTYPTDDELQDMVEYRAGLTAPDFTVKDRTVKIRKELAPAFNSMMTDFASSTSVKNLIITSGYRSKDRQQEIYDADLRASKKEVSDVVAVPGFSEHHTGYAFDFSNNASFKEHSDWFEQNSYKYGFVKRYYEDKKAITKIDNETWHFRFVGIPHAYYMTDNKLCFEEYIEKLKAYTFEKEHLNIETADGSKYEVYYVPFTEGGTKIPTPKDKAFTVSGNNVDGFIVTVTK